MASSGAPIAFMRRCRQAGALSSRNVCVTRPRPNFQCLHQPIRVASNFSQAPAVVPPPSQGGSSPQRSPSPPFVRSSVAPANKNLNPQRPTLWTSLKSLFGFRPPSAPSRLNALNNPYRARKRWPPDFRTLHPKHQFHYEKTYRRRLKLKYARPRWIKGTKAVQYGLTVSVIIYWIFFLKVEGREGTIFDAVKVYLMLE